MDDYDIGRKFKKTNPKLALEHFIKAHKSGNLDAGYQAGRIYALSKDERCLQYLNDLALCGHRKSCYYLSYFFICSKDPQKYFVSHYFLCLSNESWMKYGSIESLKYIRAKFKKHKTRKLCIEFNTLSVCSREDRGERCFKAFRVLPSIHEAVGIIYQNIICDQKLFAYYFQEIIAERDIICRNTCEEAMERLKKLDLERRYGDLKFLLFCNRDENISRLLSKLIKSDEYSYDPVIQLFKGLNCLYNLNYENACTYIKFSADKDFMPAVNDK